MDSPTKRMLSAGDVASYVDRALGVPALSGGELTGGGYAAVWKVSLADGRDVVLKVGPDPGVRLLRYEQGLMEAEARYFRTVHELLPDVPVPEVYYADPEILVMSFLPGSPLTEQPGGPAGTALARWDLGVAMSRVHGIGAQGFGYPGAGRAQGETWPEAFGAMIEDLLADAVDWGVEVPAGVIRGIVADSRAELAEVRQAATVHFDLWDGNVLMGPEGRLSGLVDGERCLHGDPLIDFVGPSLPRPIERENHPFVQGYAHALGRPVVFDDAARRRLELYRLHLFLLMVVEMPSRGMEGQQFAWRVELLSEEISQLL